MTDNLKWTQEDVSQITAALSGTCMYTLEETAKAHFHETRGEDAEYPNWNDDTDFCKAVDEDVFECSQCGWWCDISEEESEDDSPEMTCAECAESNREDEE